MNDVAEQALLPLLDEPKEAQSGIWPAQWLKAATELGQIRSREPVLPKQIQPASLDLRLGGVAYRVPASFLPGQRTTVQDKVEMLAEERIDLEEGAVLKTKHVYIVPLQEGLRLKKRVSGSANPKSSTGRLDVFCRVITDYGIEFDTIPERYNGPLWLEVAPRSFKVKVRRGSCLAQIRLRTGAPPSSDAYVRRVNEAVGLVRDGGALGDVKDGAIALSVDTQGDPASGVIGFKARKTARHIDVDKVGHYEIDDFWERVYRPESGRGLVLETDQFHILATKEMVAVPEDMAADMVAYDTMVGEFRVHYAGFFDPGFGYSERGAEGAKIVLEVRSHEVPFMIEHGQVLGRVTVERLAEVTEKPYGRDIGSSYARQGLTLGKQFKR